MIKNFLDKKPEIANNAYISETSVIIGDVTIKEKASIWFGAVVRGDEESISVGACSNVQENVVLHADAFYKILIGEGVTIGHGAIIHGCTIGDNVLIGMGAIILNGAKIGKNSIIAAGSLITQNKEFEEGSLIMGNPAKVVRKITNAEIENNKRASLNYIKLSLELGK